VDDHVLFREGLANLIDAQPDFEIVGQAESVAEAIRKAHEIRPDLILMDFSLRDGTGLDATKAILSLHPEIKIVFLTVHEENDNLFSAIRSGAVGYLLKNVPISNLLSYLRGTTAGEAAITPTMTRQILDEFSRTKPQVQADEADIPELTNRELEVLRVLITGASNQEIANELTISVNTVKIHVSNILAKLELSNRRQLISYARRHRLIPND